MSGRSRPAILFDFDGVLVDSEPAHWHAFRDALSPLGIRLTRARYERRYLAFDDRAALRAMLGDAGVEGPIEALLRRKRTLYRRRLSRGIAIPRGAVRLLRELHELQPLAIVSGAARVEIRRTLRRAGVEGLFRRIVSAESVRRGKPDPEGYRLAMRRLGLDASGCVAIEDSPGGIRAARAAGIASSFAPATLRRAGAARVVPELRALRIRDLQAPPYGGAPAAAPSRSRSAGRSPGHDRSRRPPG